MKTIPIRTKWLLSLSPILAIVLLICCYRAVAGAGRTDHPPATSAELAPLAPNPNLSIPPDHDDPGYIEARRQYRSLLAGTAPGSVSPEAFAAARVAALALPPSPLSRGRTFQSFPAPASAPPPGFLTGTLSWLFPIPPPIYVPLDNTYGGKASAMVQAIAADPTDSNIVFTGSYGGLARSRDGGVNWTYLSDGWLSQEVAAIAIDPSKPNNMFVGTGRDNIYHSVGVYASKDNGDSWAGPLGVNEFAGKIIRAVAVHPVNSDTVYVANGCSPYFSPCTGPAPGLWRSDDSGQSWVQKAPSGTSNNGLYSLAIDAANSNLYAATDAGLFTSSDDGDSWTFIPNKPAGSLSVVDSVLYLLTFSSDELFKSTNGGGSWTSIPTCSIGNNCPGQSLRFSVFAVEPSHPNVIVAGGNPSDGPGTIRLWRTENAGPLATWTVVDNIHVDQRAIAFAPDYSRDRVVYVGNDGGLIKSINHGQTWTNCNQNLPGALLQGVAISKDDSMVGGTQDNGAVFSHQGASWNFISGGDVGHVVIDPADSADAYFANAGYRYWGRYQHVPTPNLTNITPPQLASDTHCHPLPPFAMSATSPFRIMTACMRVVRSADNGSIWTTIGPGPVSSFSDYDDVVITACEAPSNSDVIYAAATNWGEEIFVTTNADDGGSAQWTNVTRSGQIGGLPIGTKIYAIAVDSTDPQTAYLACPSALFKTTNMGGSWSKLGSGALANAGYTDIVLDPLTPTNVFAASRLGVIASTDGGTSWGDLSAGLPPGTDIRGLSYNRISQQLAANTYGRGAYVIDLDSTQPEVSITAPAPGGVSGIVLITANASDNHRVAGVQFKRNGLINIGSEDTDFPYYVDWNTSGLSGYQTLTAVARDPAGNLKISTPVTVYVIADK